MSNCQCSYGPKEDSTLLERYVRQYAFGNVLDMGTGSGIQAIAAAQSSKVKSVLAVDIQKGTINYCSKNIKHRKIKFSQSNLFEKVKGKFQTIIFNPPYLPDDARIKDIALDGGKHGYEVLQRFLDSANNFLSKDGIILILFSSLTKKDKVDEIIKQNLFDSTLLEQTHIFFEDLIVYLLKKNDVLRKIESEDISKIKYLTKGHRGLIFAGNYKNKKIVVKMKNPKSLADGRVQNESKWLKILNKNGIGPRLLFARKDFFVYLYIDGESIIDYLKKSSKNEIKRILKEIFKQMRILDKLKIDKEEMHHPIKHVLVSKKTPYLIDFERTHKVKNAKNVTQFCQFVTSGHMADILLQKKIKIGKDSIIMLAKVYKKNMNIVNFNNILKAI